MASFQDALKARLSAIDSRGDSQTTWELMQAQRKRSEEEFQKKMEWQRSISDRYSLAQQNIANRDSGFSGGGVPTLSSGTSTGKSGGSAFEKFKASIGQKESNNRYSAVNRHSGAMGKYQIMPANISGKGRGWDYEAMGRDVTSAQFMASPEIQEKIATFKLQQYYNKYGAAGASVAWYAGPGAAQKYAKSGSISNRTEANGYPSVQSYVNSILGR